MKTILLILSLLPCCMYAQNCDSLLKKSSNTTSRDTITLAHPIKVLSDSKALAFYMDIQAITDKDILLYIQVTGDYFGCTDEASKIYLLFTDNTTQTFSNVSMNCKGFSMSFIKHDGRHERKDYEAALAEKTIKAIKVESMNTFYMTPVNYVQAEQFRLSAQCLFNK